MVSILLVMDDGLWAALPVGTVVEAYVSILLVMDDGLWGATVGQNEDGFVCLNPSCNG